MIQTAAADITVQLADAIADGQLDDADALLAEIGRTVPPDLLPLAAELRMAQERWADAAKLIGRIVDPSPGLTMQRRLCVNLAAIQQHRPFVYQAIMDAPPEQRFEIIDDADTAPTIAHIDGAGRRTSLTPHNDPGAALKRALAELTDPIQCGDAIGLCGLGDGYLLDHLARHPAELVMTMRQPIWLLEPDARLILAALLLHDYAGPTGPIEQPRIQWCVGPDYAGQFNQVLADDPMLPLPAVSVQHSIDSPAIDRSIQQTVTQIEAANQQLKNQIDVHYATITQPAWAAIFSDAPPRSPRMLLLTSRFTTVLQHATRDAADGFARLGWETRIAIESSDHHRITPTAVLNLLAEFKPDLLFQIDHLRHEWPNVYPPDVPFVCWVQDHLPNLLNADAGAAVNLRDYVLTMLRPMYTNLYRYPDRQIIELPKLTRVPDRPAQSITDGDDLVYVSNASQTHDQLLDAARQTQIGPESAGVAETCAERMIELHERGDALPTLWHLRQFIDALNAEHAWSLPESIIVPLVHHLNHPINNALYRQQALRWIVDAAQRSDLTLAIYGHGWADHPEFSPFARGSVAYGPDLEELTRRTRINLQIVPSICVHQRLLDGLASGGFFLVRHHASDTLLPELAAFLQTHFDEDIQSVDQAHRSAPPDVRAGLDELLQRAQCYSQLDQPIDLIQWIRCCQRGRLFDDVGTLLPRLDEISFNDAAGFDACLGRFIDDEPARRDVADAQRHAVEQRLTYAAGLRRVIHEIGQRIHSEPTANSSERAAR